jgi:hypothetical protein
MEKIILEKNGSKTQAKFLWEIRPKIERKIGQKTRRGNLMKSLAKIEETLIRNFDEKKFQKLTKN